MTVLDMEEMVDYIKVEIPSLPLQELQARSAGCQYAGCLHGADLGSHSTCGRGKMLTWHAGCPDRRIEFSVDGTAAGNP